MELTQFKSEMDRLQERYGKTKYPEVLQNILFSKFRKIDFSVFRRVVSKLIAYEPYAPLFPKFEEELRNELAIIRETEIAEIAKGSTCSSCKGLGRTSEKINQKAASYSFRCHCELGKKLYPNFPERHSTRNQSRRFDETTS